MMVLKKVRMISYLVFGLISVLFCAQLYENPTYAAPAVNIQKRIMDKAVYQGVYKCYTTTGMLKPSMSLSNYHDMGSLMGENAGHANFVNLVSGGHEGLMGRMIDSGTLRYNEGDDSLSCRQLFVGRGDRSGDNHGILEATNHEAPSENNTEAVVQFFENMGYDVVETVGGGICYTASFEKGYGENAIPVQSGNKICQREDGNLYSEPEISSLGGTGYDVAFDVQGDKVCLKLEAPGGEQLKCGNLVDNNGNSVESLNQNTLDSTIKQNICNNTSNGTCMVGDSSTGGVQAYHYNDIVGGSAAQGSLVNRSASFPGYPEHGSSIAAARRAINFLSGGQMGEDLGLSRPEKRILYQEYLTDYYEYEIDCENEHMNSATIWWFDDATGEVKKCSISREGSGLERTVHAVDDAGMFEGEINAGDIIIYLDSMTSDLYSEEELAEMGDVASGAREFEETSDDCRGMGAGRSLGWILCPILELIGDGAEGIYENMVAPMLEIKSYLFNGQDTATYRAWSTFRDIANVMFVIVLLVVIFSQVTGVGIDNYGIKRILPKLIVCIVLINMSYLICAILIDLSNILGNGLKLMFDNLGNELNVGNIMITQPAEAYPAGSSAGSGFASAAGSGLVGVTLLVGFATMVGAIWSVTIGPMVLISLLFAGLGVLISIVFTFFLLGARQSAIVVLVTVSPVIVLLSALPNTKSLYNRFVKMFQILLFVFPIMGLLVGGGNYVSKLLLLAAPGEFYMALTAMVVGIVPIFFLPSLLKEAMAALPKVGQMLSGLGDKARGVSNKTRGMVLGSDAVKNAEKTWQYQSSKSAMDRLSKKKGPLSNRQLRDLYRHAGKVESYDKEMRAARLVAAKEKYANFTNNQIEGKLMEAFVQGDTDSIDALTNLMYVRTGGSSTAGFISKLLANVGDAQEVGGAQFKNNKKMQASVRALRDTFDNNSNLSRDMRNKASDAFNMVSNNGRDSSGEFQNLEYFANKNPISDIAKAPDWTSQKDTTIARALLGNGAFSGEVEKYDWADHLLKANSDRSSATFNTLSDGSVKLLQEYSDILTRPGGGIESADAYLRSYLEDKTGGFEARENIARMIQEGERRFESGPRRSGPEPPRPPLS